MHMPHEQDPIQPNLFGEDHEQDRSEDCAGELGAAAIAHNVANAQEQRLLPEQINISDLEEPIRAGKLTFSSCVHDINERLEEKDEDLDQRRSNSGREYRESGAPAREADRAAIAQHQLETILKAVADTTDNIEVRDFVNMIRFPHDNESNIEQFKFGVHGRRQNLHAQEDLGSFVQRRTGLENFSDLQILDRVTRRAGIKLEDNKHLDLTNQAQVEEDFLQGRFGS